MEALKLRRRQAVPAARHGALDDADAAAERQVRAERAAPDERAREVCQESGPRLLVLPGEFDRLIICAGNLLLKDARHLYAAGEHETLAVGAHQKRARARLAARVHAARPARRQPSEIVLRVENDAAQTLRGEHPRQSSGLLVYLGVSVHGFFRGDKSSSTRPSGRKAARGNAPTSNQEVRR
jgi:hypothetical protein